MYKLKLFREMKKSSNFLVLILGLASLTSWAQTTDSVIVTYNKQKTVIPAPDFGYKTTIKLADSIEIIEISVARREPSDNSELISATQSTSASDKPLKKVKWYSQIEVGYTINFVSGPSSEAIIVDGSEPAIIFYNTDNLPGYKLGLSIFEKERSIGNGFSYVSGFKLGFAQSFRKYRDQPVFQDSVLHLYEGYNPVTISRLQFLFPFGFRKYIGPEKLNTRINFGSNIGASIDLIKQKWSGEFIQFSGSPLILQPFLGFEIKKIGLLTTMDLSFGSKYDSSNGGTKLSVDYGVAFLLTYRFF
jgi:hypothetical protein